MHRTIRSLSVRFEYCSIRNTRKIFSKCGTPPPSNVGISKPVINTSNLLEDINTDEKHPGNIEKSGICGCVAVMLSGSPTQYLQFAGYTAVGIGALLATLNFRQKRHVGPSNVVIITGCDSGLGFNMAQRCLNKLNMFVVATCISLSSDGAKKLQHYDKNRLLLLEVDICQPDSVAAMQRQIKELLEKSSSYVLTGLVNNAGVMCFGELEWQTENQINQVLQVNVLGNIRVTRSLLPLLRRHKGRIVTVTSHCALQALPGLAPYGASKAALRFVNDALRVEMRPYGVEVVEFIPGSFVMQSNIAARQTEYAAEQQAAFTVEQQKFYGDYFQRYSKFLTFLSGKKPVETMQDDGLMRKFEDALLDHGPKASYKYEPMRYRVYHFLFRICPVIVRDALIVRFMSMPRYTDKPASLK